MNKAWFLGTSLTALTALTACNDLTGGDDNDNNTEDEEVPASLSGIEGDYNFLILGHELEAGEDADSTYPREARVSASGEVLEGSLSAIDSGFQFSWTAGDSADTTLNWVNEGSGWQLGSESMSPLEHESEQFAEFDETGTSETFSIDDNGVFSFADYRGGAVANDLGSFAFNSGDSMEDDAGSSWSNRTEYQNIVLGAKAWNPDDSIQADFNMLGMALVLDHDTTDSNGDGGNRVGVGARVLTSGRAVLDGSGQSLDMWWHRKRAVLGLDDTSITTWEDDGGTQQDPRTISVQISDRGWVRAVDNGTAADRPFAMIAPDGEMLVTQTSKRSSDDNGNERVRYRMRVGLPRGGAQDRPTCDASTFDGQYRMLTFGMEMDPATSDHPFDVASETGRVTYDVTNGSLPSLDAAEYYIGKLEITEDDSTVTADKGTDNEPALSADMSSDCTFVVNDGDGNALTGDDINGIISPDGERVLITVTSGSWNGMILGFRTGD